MSMPPPTTTYPPPPPPPSSRQHHQSHQQEKPHTACPPVAATSSTGTTQSFEEAKRSRSTDTASESPEDRVFDTSISRENTDETQQSTSISASPAGTPKSSTSARLKSSTRCPRCEAGEAPDSHVHASLEEDVPSHSQPKFIYGAGTITRLPTELGRLHLACPLIVSSPSRISLARRIQALIPNLDSRILDSALVNVPQHVIDDAVSRITGRDCVISVGGTSAMGLAKAIAGRKDIPHICIPTTYSGSEHSSHPAADSRRREKRDARRRRSASTNGSSAASNGAASPAAESTSSQGRRSDSSLHSKTMPSVIIYDEDLTATAPPARFSAPVDDIILPKPRCRTNNDDENAQWSYIHLPGV